MIRSQNILTVIIMHPALGTCIQHWIQPC